MKWPILMMMMMICAIAADEYVLQQGPNDLSDEESGRTRLSRGDPRVDEWLKFALADENRELFAAQKNDVAWPMSPNRVVSIYRDIVSYKEMPASVFTIRVDLKDRDGARSFWQIKVLGTMSRMLLVDSVELVEAKPRPQLPPPSYLLGERQDDVQ
jgi:hypothetical protein